MTDLPDNNPKTAFGIKKPAIFSVVSAASLLVLGKVMALGAKKYGAFNYRENKVAASVYTDALTRHLILWNAGQDNDAESEVSHLGHIMACCSILIDAQAAGNLIDDRPKNEHEITLLESLITT